MPRAKSGRIKADQAVSTVRRNRTDLIMSEAKNAGLVGGPKDAVIRGRVSTALVKAAKKRAGVRTDTELLEVALSNLALADDFGDKFLKRKGTVDPDLDLEL
ncbi:MAG: hypothetical protein HC869_14910 [Rhodospirillales bacterium]|nr:hypothetical protein [Rhodospirillales bacterium]